MWVCAVGLCAVSDTSVPASFLRYSLCTTSILNKQSTQGGVQGGGVTSIIPFLTAQRYAHFTSCQPIDISEGEAFVYD